MASDSKRIKNNIKSFTELLTLAQTDNAISGLKFHALAPESQCNSEQMWGFSYNTLSMASGGYAIDPCGLNDYSDFMSQMVADSQDADIPVFATSKPIKSIVSVEVNGYPTDQYELFDDRSLVIDGLTSASKHEVKIVYLTD